MKPNQLIVVILLASLPLGVMVGVGFYYLLSTGWLFWVSWPMLCCWVLAYLFGSHWQKAAKRRVAEEPPPLHYTDRDRLAWKTVEERIHGAEKAPDLEPGRLYLYVDVAKGLAEELAAVYHPNAANPIGNLTIPELLTVVELAAHDLGELSRTYLPGSHLITIEHFRQVKAAAKWYQLGRQALWAVSAAVDPVQTGIRYAATQTGLRKPSRLFKENVVLWLHVNFIRQMGHYFIELYSGRLKIGATRYRELMAGQRESQPSGAGVNAGVGSDRGAEPRTVTIAFLGQVQAGKSRVIHALLGERRPLTEVTLAADGVNRYELHATGWPAELDLLEVTGYGRGGLPTDQFDTALEVALAADAVCLTIDGRQPARDADIQLLRRLREWFSTRPDLKMPPILVVLTHTDLLPPATEWSPPYDWRRPTKPKEKAIAEAVTIVREQFGPVAAFAPVCTAEGKTHGVQEELLPQLSELLGEARAVAFLRCLGEQKSPRVVDQLLAVGKQLLLKAITGR
ncbi:GTPase domain-containing protein [Gemmata sp. JC673]|uniref:GTPase domain-containing protein n=1 Tax=Gemmata algarum TaxID=2975278 RepID=A0ABU5F851_9BACT|nr:GTPase domain-containing protein [Gemmata algarum]MDY3563778.1 GTPase domain-containing protein [Gemmata algarum]